MSVSDTTPKTRSQTMKSDDSSKFNITSTYLNSQIVEESENSIEFSQETSLSEANLKIDQLNKIVKLKTGMHVVLKNEIQ